MNKEILEAATRSPTRKASIRKLYSTRSKPTSRPRSHAEWRGVDVRVAINRKTGGLRTFRRWKRVRGRLHRNRSAGAESCDWTMRAI